MRVTQVMDPDSDPEIRSLESGRPDMLTEPPAGDMPVGVDDSRWPGLVLAASSAPRPVGRNRRLAMGTPARACVVGAESAVPVAASGVVRPGHPQRFRIGDNLQSRWRQD